MEKIAVVIKGGMVQDVYGTPNLYQTDVEIIDLDTTDTDEEQASQNRLQVVLQYLCKLR